MPAEDRTIAGITEVGKKSIQVKIVSFLLLALLSAITLLLIFWTTTEKRSLLDSADQTLMLNTLMLNQTIRAIMLDGEAPVAVKTMENLKEIEEFDAIGIYRKDGTAAFSDYSTLNFVNQYQDEIYFEKTERVPADSLMNNHFKRVISSHTLVKIENREEQLLEYYFPLLNTPECRTCHGADHFLRGVEHVQISISYVYDQIRRYSSLSIIIMFGIGTIAAVTIIFFLRNLIVKPLIRIGDVVQLVGKGDLDVKLAIERDDELGTIASYINEMIRGLKERTDELQITQDVTIQSLASLAETRDNETGNHIYRTQHYVRILAEYLNALPQCDQNLSEEIVQLLYKSSPLHDIGKVGVPDAILLKTGPLTDQEWIVMKKHTYYGREALRIAEERLGSTSFLSIAQELIYSHHEKWDGSGYPEGLSGPAIPLSGRIMAVADVYDALRSERPYKKEFTHEKTREIIIEGKGTHFDPLIVDAFLARETDFISIADKYRD